MLSDQKCVPCEGGTAPLDQDMEEKYHDEVSEWDIDRSATHKIERTFICGNFEQAVHFIDEITNIAEEEGHHPDIFLHDYKKLTITLYTHAIGGLSVNDFILASKIDKIAHSYVK